MDDLIKRQAAIESLGEEPMVWNDEYHEITEREQWRRDVAAIEAVPSAQPQIIHCKDCKHRGTEECPMHYEEWVSFEEDGYIESDNIAHDQTRDDGFCDRGERGE